MLPKLKSKQSGVTIPYYHMYWMIPFMDTKTNISWEGLMWDEVSILDLGIHLHNATHQSGNSTKKHRGGNSTNVHRGVQFIKKSKGD